MTYVTVDVDIDTIMDEISTEDLVEELERRSRMDYGFDNPKELVEKIHQKRRLNQNYQAELDTLIYSVLGKFV